jgi:hypothetical protein
MFADFWRKAYASSDPRDSALPSCNLPGRWLLDVAALKTKIKRMNSRKAVPKAASPVLVLQACVEPVASFLDARLTEAWTHGREEVPQVWKDGWIVLLSTPA